MKINVLQQNQGLSNPNVTVPKPYDSPIAAGVGQAAGNLGQFAEAYSIAKTNSDLSKGLTAMKTGLNDYLRNFTETLPSLEGRDIEEVWREKWNTDSKNMFDKILANVSDTRARDKLTLAWENQKVDTENLLLNKAQDIDIGLRGAEMFSNYSTILNTAEIDTPEQLEEAKNNMLGIITLGDNIFWSSAEAYKMQLEGNAFLENKHKQKVFQNEYTGYQNRLMEAYNRTDITFQEAYDGANKQISEEVVNEDMKKGLYELNQEMFDTAKENYDNQLAVITQDQRNMVKETYNDETLSADAAFTAINAFIGENSEGKAKEELYKLNADMLKQRKLREAEQKKQFQSETLTRALHMVHNDDFEVEDDMDLALLNDLYGMEANQNELVRKTWRQRQKDKEDLLDDKKKKSDPETLKFVKDSMFEDNMDAVKFEKILTEKYAEGTLAWEDRVMLAGKAETGIFKNLNDVDNKWWMDQVDSMPLDSFSKRELFQEISDSIYNASKGYNGQRDKFALPVEDINKIITNWTEKATSFNIDSALYLRENKTRQDLTEQEKFLKYGQAGNLWGTMSDNSLYMYSTTPGMTEDNLKEAVSQDKYGKAYDKLEKEEKSIVKLNLAMGEMIKAEQILFDSEIGKLGYEIVIGDDGLPYFWDDKNKDAYKLLYLQDQNEEVWHKYNGNTWEPSQDPQHRYIENDVQKIISASQRLKEAMKESGFSGANRASGIPAEQTNLTNSEEAEQETNDIFKYWRGGY